MIEPLHSPSNPVITRPVDDGNSSFKPMPRRQLMRLLAVVGGTTILGTNFASADLYERWVDRLRSGGGRYSNSADISSDLVRVLGRDTMRYASYLQRLRLRHISVEQIIRPHANKRGSVQNTLPPTSMWRNIRSTLMVLDRIASLMREDVRIITSAYRSPAYNARCPGAARDSMHTRNNAIDVKFSSSPGRVVEAANSLRNRGYFKGGVGRYGSFTHIDTRGENVSW